MKLKDYSLRIKKNIAVLLHIIFLTLAVVSISVMYLNTQIGSGIFWLLDRNYYDSQQFQEQLQQDLDHIFKYVSYRDVFETDGALDLSKEMFAVSHGDSTPQTYTLEEVIRYAKSQGFYLNEQFDVVSDLFIYDTASTSRDYLVKWRAYDVNRTIQEPGDAYSSLLDLSREVLNCLGEYYTVYYRMIANPSNLYFKILYEADNQDTMLYTNAGDKDLNQLRSLGRYCFLSSDSIIIETNLHQVPQNITVAMEQNDIYNAANYYVMAAVDTSYAADDAYSEANDNYNQLRARFLEGLFGLGIGIIGCLTTLYYLILTSGYRTEERTNPYLHGFDTITTESCVFLTLICTMFMLFLGEKIGYKLVHLLVSESSWEFSERMLRTVIVYGCCMTGAFSLLRRYKMRRLWENSMLHHFMENLSQYFAHRTFSRRLCCLYLTFVGIQAGVIAIIAVLLKFRGYAVVKTVIVTAAVALIILDYLVFNRLFWNARQRDRITDTVARIAEGDTSYQMSLDGLNGKELEVAKMLNSIGTGLERALQEQLKSERLKADLITNVSHDIKTPLTSIINYVDLIKRENIQNDKIQGYLDVLEQKSQRLKTLTEDLVEASKVSSGNVKLEIGKIDLVEMIWQTNGEFEEKFAMRHLELVASLPNEAIIIEADGRHLWRVLENLYNNAFKYAMERSRVYTEVIRDDGMVSFTIKNVSESPLNINPDELTERFVRGDVSRTTEGSGLGLSIAKSLTELQGGSFEIVIDGDLYKVRIGFEVSG